MIGMLEELERLFDDPARAWAALKTEIEYRKALRESRMSDRAARSAIEPGTAGQAGPDSATPPGATTRREPRPFLGFDREKATYERCKASLLEESEGKWVVIVGEEVIGPFEDMSEAMSAGYRRFGLGPLFIKEVLAQEPPPIILPPYVDVSCLT
jgi:hypothetical protein